VELRRTLHPVDGGIEEPSQAEVRELRKVAETAVRRVTVDEHIVQEALDHASLELGLCWAQIGVRDGRGETFAARRQWMRAVAVNYAKRAGKKQAKDIPFGRQGSQPFAVYGPEEDDQLAGALDRMFQREAEAKAHVGRLDAGEQHGRLSAEVAHRLDFERAWAPLSPEARWLLTAKHVDGMTAKEIADILSRRSPITAAQVAHKLTDARRAARPLLAAVFDDEA
jgi:DNA-directed RNA polymerase specialized sigma24 family protein